MLSRRHFFQRYSRVVGVLFAVAHLAGGQEGHPPPSGMPGGASRFDALGEPFRN